MTSCATVSYNEHTVIISLRLLDDVLMKEGLELTNDMVIGCLERYLARAHGTRTKHKVVRSSDRDFLSIRHRKYDKLRMQIGVVRV